MTLENALERLRAYCPKTEGERADLRITLAYALAFPDTVLTRANEIAHFTASAFIVNHNATKTLMARHILRDCWAWTGGHVDGNADFLSVALREAAEETGLADVAPLAREAASIDILTMPAHIRRGRYVGAHLHLNVAYLLTADETARLSVRTRENTAVAWFSREALQTDLFPPADRALYDKLLIRAREALSRSR